MKRIQIAATAVVVGWMSLMPITGETLEEKEKPSPESLRVDDEPRYQGKPLGYWLAIIRERDAELLSAAFGAIRSLGPQARSAVPELMRLVSAPYVPIQIGTDSDTTILDKLMDIEIRSEAIDALASIGPSASPAVTAVIQWALTVRVISKDRSPFEGDERFMDLLTLDAEYRLRVIEAVGEFGEAAVPAVVRLLESSNEEKRKLAVAILGLDAIGIASELLRSGDCNDRRLGIAILSDMEPIVAKAYVNALRRTLVCDAN